jgi:phosphoglycolate phosphatase-like HAD superfamily hydrolase
MIVVFDMDNTLVDAFGSIVRPGIVGTTDGNVDTAATLSITDVFSITSAQALSQPSSSDPARCGPRET